MFVQKFQLKILTNMQKLSSDIVFSGIIYSLFTIMQNIFLAILSLLICGFTSQSTTTVMLRWSVNLTTLFLGRRLSG